MAKKFNSNTAKILAQKHGIKLKDIPTNRIDEKATTNDVKFAILLKTIPSKPNKMGKNFGMGMLGNPIPFQRY